MNLEHLYHHQVINAFKELVRISEYIIITIPTINSIVNVRWLTQEIKEATEDNVELNEIEYESLSACVHKSGYYEDSLIEAGFKKFDKFDTKHRRKVQACYYGKSDNIDISKIKYHSIKKEDIPSNLSYTKQYITILQKSLGFRV